jgi:hypothetical protein
MSVPGSGWQLLILLLFVLPGSVYQTVRTRLRGPIPSDSDTSSKILRALAVSTALNAIYLAIFGEGLLELAQARSLPEVEQSTGLRQAGLWALLCLFVVPAVVSLMAFWASRWSWPHKFPKISPERRQRWKWVRPAYHPSPRSWDYVFTDIEPCYVRVLGEDGRWRGGWLGDDSMAASFPEEPALYVERLWELDDDGDFVREVPYNKGAWLRCDDARVVELLESGESVATSPRTWRGLERLARRGARNAQARK